MGELQKPWGDGNVFDFYRSDDCDKEFVIPIGKNSNGLSLMNALYTVHQALLDGSTDVALVYLNSLAELIVGNHYDLGDAILEDIIVNTSIENLDKSIEDLLNDTP